MRILHVVRQFYPAVGGLENFVRSLVVEQNKSGLSPEVLTLDRVFHQGDAKLDEVEVLDGINVRRISYVGSYKYPIAPKVLKYIKSFDLIHVHGVDFFVDYLAFTKLLHNQVLVLSTHGGFFHTSYAGRLKKIYFNTITRFSLQSFKEVYACSVNDYDIFKPLVGNKVKLIENGVDTCKFSGASSSTFTKNFITIGRFSNNKRLDKLIEFFSYLVQVDKEYTLAIIGKDWDGNESVLRKKIKHLCLDSNIRILTGLSDQEIKAEINASSFIVSASEYEGFGLTLIEGMSAGLVPIATAIPSFKNIIDNASVGFISDFKATESEAVNVDRFVNGLSDSYTKYRLSLMEDSEKYAWPSVAKSFISSYESILGVKEKVLQGIPVKTGNSIETVKALDERIESKKVTKVAYANAHTINLARNDKNYSEILQRFMVLNDGVGVSIASKFKYGELFSENLNGTDFTPKFLNSTKHSLKVFLLGAKPKVVEEAHRRWSIEFPNHEWVGFHHGYFDENENDAVCELINKTKPDLLLVAMGNPIQEKWIDRHFDKTGATIFMGVGALFDFVAEEVPRAPSWVRKIRSEWVYRLIQEPKRMWKRYLIGNLSFLFSAWLDRKNIP